MRIIYNRFLPVRGFTAMAFFGIILARREYRPLPSWTIRHETIHCRQARDCGGWLLFYLRYFCQWLRYGYREMPFEREAYYFDPDPSYIERRPSRNWERFRTL